MRECPLLEWTCTCYVPVKCSCYATFFLNTTDACQPSVEYLQHYKSRLYIQRRHLISGKVNPKSARRFAQAARKLTRTCKIDSFIQFRIGGICISIPRMIAQWPSNKIASDIGLFIRAPRVEVHRRGMKPQCKSFNIKTENEK